MIKRFKDFLAGIVVIFRKKKHVKLGIYGPPNAGKCVTPETEIVIHNGEIKTIKQIFDEVKEKAGIDEEDFNEIYIDIRWLNLIIPSYDYKSSLKIGPKKVSFAYAQKYKGKIYNIKTRSGRSIRITPDHPLIKISNNGIEKTRSSELRAGDCIAISKKLSLSSDIKLPEIMEGFNVDSNGMIQSIARFHNPKQISVPTYIDEDLTRFIGYALTESHHRKNEISFFNTDENTIAHFKYLTKKLFNVEYIEKMNKGVTQIAVYSKTLTDYLDKILELKPVTSEYKEIPARMMGLSDNLTAALLRTLFDMEGYVPKNPRARGAEIEFSSKSKKMVEQVQILSSRFDILGRFKEKKVNGESYWSLLIGGSDNHRIFREKIGFNISYKKERLDKLCDCELKRNRFYLPIMSLLEELRLKLGLTQKEFFLDGDHISRMIKDNKITYHRIAKMAEKTNNKFIKTLAGSDNAWDEIASIEKEDYDGVVYDLTVEDTHTFITSSGLIAHNTRLANRICQDWLGEDMGNVSAIPHETREIQQKEKVIVQSNGKKLSFNLIDTPGIATRIDYEDFIKKGLDKKEAQTRAKEATKGVIEAIKWLDNMDAVLVVLDSTKNPYDQVNITIIGNLAARNIPVMILGNKIDLKKANLKKIESAFPQYKVVGISAEYGDNVEQFYKELFKLVK